MLVYWKLKKRKKLHCAKHGHSFDVVSPIKFIGFSCEVKIQCKICKEKGWKKIHPDDFDNLVRNVKSGKIK